MSTFRYCGLLPNVRREARFQLSRFSAADTIFDFASLFVSQSVCYGPVCSAIRGTRPWTNRSLWATVPWFFEDRHR